MKWYASKHSSLQHEQQRTKHGVRSCTPDLLELWVRHVGIHNVLVERVVVAIAHANLVVQDWQDARRLLLDQVKYVLIVHKVDLKQSQLTNR